MDFAGEKFGTKATSILFVKASNFCSWFRRLDVRETCTPPTPVAKAQVPGVLFSDVYSLMNPLPSVHSFALDKGVPDISTRKGEAEKDEQKTDGRCARCYRSNAVSL